MATATGTTKHLTLKLLIDKKKDVVLFAEAGKDVVDFIFHLLALPMGTVVRLVTKTAMGGSLGNIYDSVETLDNTYWQSSCNNKDIPLKPKTPNYGGGSFETLLLPSANNNATADFTQTYYSITLLNKFKVTNLSAVEEKVVDFGFEEGVKLLKASMESTNVLTQVFLRGKKKRAAAH